MVSLLLQNPSCLLNGIESLTGWGDSATDWLNRCFPSHPIRSSSKNHVGDLNWNIGQPVFLHPFHLSLRKKEKKDGEKVFYRLCGDRLKEKRKNSSFYQRRISFVTLRKIFSFRSSVYQTCVATIKTMPLVLHTPHILYWFIAFADRSINLESHSRFNIPPSLILLSCIFTAKYFDEKDLRTSLYE